MMRSMPRLNNMKLDFQRRDLTYEAVMIDLVLMDIADRNKVEAWLGYKIGDNLKPPTHYVPGTEDDPLE